MAKHGAPHLKCDPELGSPMFSSVQRFLIPHL
jgi:hypothetical protein